MRLLVPIMEQAVHVSFLRRRLSVKGKLQYFYHAGSAFLKTLNAAVGGFPFRPGVGWRGRSATDNDKMGEGK